MRYFFFSYVANHKSGQATGNLFFSRNDFPSREWIANEIKKDISLSNIAITGWQEFNSKEDYDAFSGA